MPTTGTIAVLGAEARRAREDQDRRLASFETRAGVMLGFSGTIAALVATRHSAWDVVVLGLLVVSAIAGVVALWPRRLKDVNPDRARLELAGRPDGDEVEWELTKVHATAWTKQEKVVALKGAAVTVAGAAVVAAVAALLLASLSQVGDAPDARPSDAPVPAHATPTVPTNGPTTTPLPTAQEGR